MGDQSARIKRMDLQLQGSSACTQITLPALCPLGGGRQLRFQLDSGRKHPPEFIRKWTKNEIDDGCFPAGVSFFRSSELGDAGAPPLEAPPPHRQHRIKE
eukprot:gene27092-biopygen6645